MNVGRILLFSVVLAIAQTASAKYERALDGKTKIWHNAPERQVQASWSGDRDEKGYATGRGTLTWFRIERGWLTGSLLPSTKYIQVSQYTGKMVEGKLEGSVVNVTASGKTYHAKFADGSRTGKWVAGPSPTSRKPAEQEVAEIKPLEAPSEAPPPEPKLDQHVAETPEAAAVQPKEPVAATPKPKEPVAAAPHTKAPAAEHPAEPVAKTEDSLRSLAMPPSTLSVSSLNKSPEPSAQAEETADTTVVLAPSPAPASPSVSINDDDARTVAALDSEFHAAVKTNDAATIDRILADDFVLVHGATGTLSKADVMKKAREKQAKYEHQEIQEGTQKVRVWRDTAVVTETVWVKGSENGKPVDQKMSVTETYVRTPTGWRYVSGQASLPAK
jgi:ketosteroid isomerase-like protein